MRLRAPLLFGLFALEGILVTSHASADTKPKAAEATAADTELARKHFKNGVKLYQAANYTGALAEFEAAYAIKPGPGSLQNIALCQKALFRYGEAADSLGRLLRRHGSELSEGERQAAALAKEELENLVGTLRISVKPEQANVTLDGAPLTPAQRLSSVRVNVGEHTLTADAPGYATLTRSVRVAGGQKDVPVELTLEPVSGFLEVRASDPAAAIAIDGRPVAIGQWVGPVTAGEDHLIQVYRSGFEPFEERVKVDRGKLRIVEGKLGPAAPPSNEPAVPLAPGQLPAPPTKPKPVGWYAIGALTIYGTNARPFDVDLSKAESSAGGIGARVGRRIWPTLSLEGLLELGQVAVKGACDEGSPGALLANTTCEDDNPVIRDYDIAWIRLGPALRLMNPDGQLRAIGGISTGLVYHRLRFKAARNHPLQGATNHGWDPYFLLELGIAANWRHFLFGLDLAAMVDGARGLDDQHGVTAFEESGRTLGFLGVGLRIGWSEWGR